MSDENALEVGDLAYDTGRETLARVMAVEERRIFLRPTGGGVEWTAPPERVRLPTASEKLRPRVAEANAQSAHRWGRG